MNWGTQEFSDLLAAGYLGLMSLGKTPYQKTSFHFSLHNFSQT